MNIVYDEYTNVSENPMPEDSAQGFDLVRMTEMGLGQQTAFIGLARAWTKIPPASQAEILAMIPKIITNRQVVSYLDKGVSVANKVGGNIVMVALAGLSLGYEAIKNLRRWWKGEITGERCAKNVVDASVAIVAGIGGGIGGAVIGSLAGPIGLIAGTVIGGLVSTQAASLLCDRLTQYIFGIPKSEALENAYNYFGVKMKASNHDINQAFRRLCLKHHPDKGGQNEEFITVQINMGIIKTARGE
jgi:hypothetical protein